jgi:hypothetical protein
MSSSERDLASCYEAGLRWVCDSAIRAPDGSYRSIYDPATRSCDDWYGNHTCLLSTAGAVMALKQAGLEEPCRQSANHVCDLALKDGPLAGALRSGSDSTTVFTNWMLSAALALLRAGQHYGVSRYQEVAQAAGRFVIQHAQRPDGSILQSLSTESGIRWRDRLQPLQVWCANCVESFRALAEATGDDAFTRAADAFVRWLAPLQRANGSFPMYRHTVPGRVAFGLYNRDVSELLRGCRQGHPTAHTHAMKALLLAGRVDDARRVAKWLERHLGPNGLLYQFYYPGGARSVEEDVMPTAHFGLIVLEHPELGIERAALDRMAAGVAYAQIRSDADADADGGIRGLPLHATQSGRAYCWDTTHGIRFLRALRES